DMAAGRCSTGCEGRRPDGVTRRAWLLFAAMAVIWGVPYLLIKVAVGELTPTTLVFVRTGIGALLLVPLAASRGSLRPLLGHWRMVLAYAIGPMIVARRLSGVPALGVVAASLALTAVVYAPLGVAQLPHALPSAQVLLAVAGLGVVCTAVAFLLFFALIAEAGPLRAQ